MRLRNFVFCVLLSMVFLGADLNISVNALNSEEYVEERKEIVLINIEYLNETEWIETIITEEVAHVSTFSTNSKSGTKTVNHYNGNTLLWSASLRGTFTYGNGTSKATSATISTNSYDSKWTAEILGSGTTGNKAYGSARGKRYLFGLVVQTIDLDVSLSCSPDGTLY